MEIKELVAAYLNFFNKVNRDPQELAPLLAEQFSFKGPLGEFKTRESFLQDLKRDALVIASVSVQQILAEGGKASALYDLSSSDSDIGNLKLSEWFDVENGKITRIFSTYDATLVKETMTRI